MSRSHNSRLNVIEIDLFLYGQELVRLWNSAGLEENVRGPPNY